MMSLDWTSVGTCFVCVQASTRDHLSQPYEKWAGLVETLTLVRDPLPEMSDVA